MGTDGKLHFVNSAGADTALNFSSGDVGYKDFIAESFSNSTKTNQIIIPNNISKIIIVCASTSTTGVTTTISGDCIVSEKTLSTYEKVYVNYHADYFDVYEFEINGAGGTINISHKSTGKCSFSNAIFY